MVNHNRTVRLLISIRREHFWRFEAQPKIVVSVRSSSKETRSHKPGRESRKEGMLD